MLIAGMNELKEAIAFAKAAESKEPSRLSPLARALMKFGPGDRVVLHAPGGSEALQILDVRYERIPVKPFKEPPGAESASKPRPRARR